MATVSHKEESEMTVIYENVHDDSVRSVALKSRSVEDSKVPAAVPGIKLYRLVAVSFGLLCMLQTVLNISLCLVLFEASCKHLTEERDRLSRINLIIDSSCKNLTEERDALQTNLSNFVLQHNALTEERDAWKRQLRSLGWMFFNQSAYYISSVKKTWNESRDDCLLKGADLMIINSKEEQNFTSQFKKYMWIGLTDSEKKGTWKWVDGTPLTTSYWGPKEPNGLGQEDCVEIKYYDLENSWNDERCQASHFWICEKKASL